MYTRRNPIKTIGASLLSAVVMLSALASPTSAQTPGPTPATTFTGNLTVYAAASLKDAFTEIGKDFEAKNAGTKIRFSFAGSQQLAEQIGFGAPADVFASANIRLMDAVIKTTRVMSGTQRIFTRNRLVVVLPKNNPAQLKTLNDLAKKNTKLVLAAKQVPVGQYTLDFLSKASALPTFGNAFSQTVLANVVSYEQDVRAVFTKVALGEADAGVVYASDIVADKRNSVRTINIPDALNTLATYPIAPLSDSPNKALAQAFVNYVLSADGQKTLAKYGFISR